jgi:hypothetical protein
VSWIHIPMKAAAVRLISSFQPHCNGYAYSNDE